MSDQEKLEYIRQLKAASKWVADGLSDYDSLRSYQREYLAPALSDMAATADKLATR